MQNSNRMMKCHGRKCVENNIKHKGKDLIQSDTNKTKRFCAECYEIDKAEKVEQRKLYYFIVEHYGEVNGMIRRQIKKLTEEGYTLKNIRLSLDYFIRVKKQEYKREMGVAIVPYVHEEMIAYYKEKKRRAENTQLLNKKVKKMKMLEPKRRYNHKEEKQINLEELANAIK
jgi:hypothetical protein